MTVRSIVVCPTNFERDCLRRAQRAGVLPHTVRIEVCGPGAEPVAAWARQLANDDLPVVLAGVAGAARERTDAGAPLAPGSAWIVTEARDGDGGAWRPTMPVSTSASACVVTSSAQVVIACEAKRQFAARTGCDLIDLEAVAFARCAEERGWSWAVVRGVSDDVHTPLPSSIGEWVDRRGHPRPFRIAAALARHPGLVAEVRAIHRHGRLAMRAVAELIARMLEDS